jgi:hypothetical protein
MKTKLLTILNQCIYNKTIVDFNVIIELINTINDDKTSDIKLSQSNIGLYLSMFNNGRLLSVMFTDNNALLFSLPSDIGKTYVIKNCSYNMQYSDIKALLNSDN